MIHRSYQISCAIQFTCSFATTSKDGAFKVDIIFSDLGLDMFKTICSRENISYATLYSSVVNSIIKMSKY